MGQGSAKDQHGSSHTGFPESLAGCERPGTGGYGETGDGMDGMGSDVAVALSRFDKAAHHSTTSRSHVANGKRVLCASDPYVASRRS